MSDDRGRTRAAFRDVGSRRFFATAAIAAGGVGLVVAVIVAILNSWEPEAWTPIAAWATAGIALAAGLVALGQLEEARRLRAEQLGRGRSGRTRAAGPQSVLKLP